MLVITGTQRSGTSLVAQMFQKEGYDLGTEWWDDKAEGGLDNPLICAFYRDHLGDKTFPFDDMKLPKLSTRELRSRFADLHQDRKVVKFSYLCMNPAFVTIWSRIRPPWLGDSFLVMRRMPREVYASKMRVWDRFKHDSPLLKQSFDELEYNFWASFKLLEGLGYQVNLCSFRGLLEEFCINDNLPPQYSISRETWENTVDTDKVHF